MKIPVRLVVAHYVRTWVRTVLTIASVFLAILMLFFVTDVFSRPDAYEGDWGNSAEATYKELGITPLPSMVDQNADSGEAHH